MTDRILIPEVVVEGKRLGRHIAVDAKSSAYPAELAPGIVSVVHPSFGLPLNQANAGSCTAEAECGALNTVPHLGKGKPLTQSDAYSLYSDEQVLEGYGPYPPNDNGGSGLEVCQAALNRKWLRGYTHATGVVAALKALVIRPVITGVNWYTSFDSPGQNGLVQIGPGATVRGGHEIMAHEIDEPAQLVWFWNSWGESYGVGGRFCMTFDTWDQLLQQGGDVTVPLTSTGWNL